MRTKKQTLIFLLALSVIVFFSNCGIYSFKGGSIEAKTVSVASFGNLANQVVPSLAENLTEKLKDKFVKEMKMTIVDDDAEISFEGNIVDYKMAPASVSGTESAASTRLTITVKVIFENNNNPENSYEANFSNYIDFSSNENFADIESELHEELLNMLVEDIFNKAANNW